MNPINIAGDNQLTGVEELAAQFQCDFANSRPQSRGCAHAVFEGLRVARQLAQRGRSEDESDRGSSARPRGAAPDDTGQNSNTLGDILRGGGKSLLEIVGPE